MNMPTRSTLEPIISCLQPPIDLTEDMHREIDDDSYDEESKINSGQTFESVALVVEDDESIDVECRR